MDSCPIPLLSRLPQSRTKTVRHTETQMIRSRKRCTYLLLLLPTIPMSALITASIILPAQTGGKVWCRMVQRINVAIVTSLWLLHNQLSLSTGLFSGPFLSFQPWWGLAQQSCTQPGSSLAVALPLLRLRLLCSSKATVMGTWNIMQH